MYFHEGRQLPSHVHGWPQTNQSWKNKVYIFVCKFLICEKIYFCSFTAEGGLFPCKDPLMPNLTNLVSGHFCQDSEVLGGFEQEAVTFWRSGHVFVDPENGNKPTEIPQNFRDNFEPILDDSIKETL